MNDGKWGFFKDFLDTTRMTINKDILQISGT